MNDGRILVGLGLLGITIVSAVRRSGSLGVVRRRHREPESSLRFASSVVVRNVRVKSRFQREQWQVFLQIHPFGIGSYGTVWPAALEKRPRWSLFDTEAAAMAFAKAWGDDTLLFEAPLGVFREGPRGGWKEIRPGSEEAGVESRIAIRPNGDQIGVQLEVRVGHGLHFEWFPFRPDSEGTLRASPQSEQALIRDFRERFRHEIPVVHLPEGSAGVVRKGRGAKKEQDLVARMIEANEQGRAAAAALKVGDYFGGAMPAAADHGYERDTPEYRMFVDGFLDVLEKRGQVSITRQGRITGFDKEQGSAGVVRRRGPKEPVYGPYELLWDFEDPEPADSFTSEKDAEAVILHEYQAVLGAEGYVRRLHGYQGSDSIERVFDPPIRVRVLPTREPDLLRRYDRFIDPVWNVELVDPLPDPDLSGLRTKGMRSFWIDGKSVRLMK